MAASHRSDEFKVLQVTPDMVVLGNGPYELTFQIVQTQIRCTLTKKYKENMLDYLEIEIPRDLFFRARQRAIQELATAPISDVESGKDRARGADQLSLW